MADITLRTDAPGGVTCVSNAFIDSYMTGANGEFVKVYLYLLRSLSRRGDDFSLSAVADELNHTETDVMRALKYWQKVGLLSLEVSRGELVGVCLNDPVVGITASVSRNTPVSLPMEDLVAKTQKESAPVEKADTPVASQDVRPQYTPSQLEYFRQDDSFAELLYFSERFIGKTLSQHDVNTLVYWFDELKMSADLIEYLIETSVDQGHTSFYYMDAIALKWHESGIKTTEDAKLEKENHGGLLSKIKSTFGINRDLAASELEYIKRWKSEYRLDDILIVEACKRTILSSGKISFPYADSILERWFKAGVSSMDDVAKLDMAHSTLTNRPKPVNSTTANFTQRDYDFDALERALLSQN